MSTDLKGTDVDIFTDGKSKSDGIALTMTGEKQECIDNVEGLRLTINLKCD